MPLLDYEDHKTYMRERYHRFTPAQRHAKKLRDDTRRDAVLSMLVTIKLESGCADCGYAENPDALQFDHVRGPKVDSVASLTTGTLERLLDEVEKCEVRCANCHAIVTAERRRA